MHNIRRREENWFMERKPAKLWQHGQVVWCAAYTTVTACVRCIWLATAWKSPATWVVLRSDKTRLRDTYQRIAPTAWDRINDETLGRLRLIPIVARMADLCTVCMHQGSSIKDLGTEGEGVWLNADKSGQGEGFIFTRATLCVSAYFAVARCLFVCLSVGHVGVLHPDGWRYRQTSFSTR